MQTKHGVCVSLCAKSQRAQLTEREGLELPEGRNVDQALVSESVAISDFEMLQLRQRHSGSERGVRYVIPAQLEALQPGPELLVVRAPHSRCSLWSR